jgi:hypothetical protein
VLRFRDACVQASRRELGKGRNISGRIHVLLANKAAFAVELKSLPPHDRERPDRRIAIAAMAHSLRELIRQQGLVAEAIVTIAEAWYSPLGDLTPTFSPDREEGLVAGVVTPDVGWMTVYPILREPGRRGRGHIRLGDPISGGMGSSQVGEGLLARR